jgi:hypothetical protein
MAYDDVRRLLAHYDGMSDALFLEDLAQPINLFRRVFIWIPGMWNELLQREEDIVFTVNISRTHGYTIGIHGCEAQVSRT